MKNIPGSGATSLDDVTSMLVWTVVVDMTIY